MRLFSALRNFEKRVRAHYDVDMSTPENRRKNQIYRRYFDHEILRGIWTNFYEIAPGAFRSNHPTRARLAKMKAAGINDIVNLRGTPPSGHYWAEKQWCDELGLRMHNVSLNARALVPRETILKLIKIFRTVDRPFVMHCKSGADRAGLASAIYLMVIEQQPVAQAKKMLSPKYFHIRNKRVGILDYMLECYEADTAKNPIDFDTWVETVYDPKTITQNFRRGIPAQ